MEFLLAAAFLLAIGLWILTIHLDKNRVRNYLEKDGRQVLSIHWRLFGHGWLVESSREGGNRIYEVEYKDVYENTHHVWCKTAMLSGVYTSNDKITAHATTLGRAMTAEEKVAILEDELRKARAQR